MATGSVPWHYTTVIDLLDHWQTVVAVLIALLAAFITLAVTLTAESRKAYRERQKKELTQLNGISTAMGYNLEALWHIVTQQLLPHREHSHAALAALRPLENNTAQLHVFVETMHPEFPAMTTRCPEPYFIDLEFFKDVPFVVTKDPELLKRSGWMVSYARALKELISEQNRRIDIATNTSLEDHNRRNVDFQVLEEQIRVQAHEIITSLFLFEQLVVICKKLKKLTMTYKKKFGVRYTVVISAHIVNTMLELRRIAEERSPNLPPPDPESSLTVGI
jgi:hypothetical protein